MGYQKSHDFYYEKKKLNLYFYEAFEAYWCLDLYKSARDHLIWLLKEHPKFFIACEYPEKAEGYRRKAERLRALFTVFSDAGLNDDALKDGLKPLTEEQEKAAKEVYSQLRRERFDADTLARLLILFYPARFTENEKVRDTLKDNLGRLINPDCCEYKPKEFWEIWCLFGLYLLFCPEDATSEAMLVLPGEEEIFYLMKQVGYTDKTVKGSRANYIPTSDDIVLSACTASDKAETPCYVTIENIANGGITVSINGITCPQRLAPKGKIVAIRRGRGYTSFLPRLFSLDGMCWQLQGESIAEMDRTGKVRVRKDWPPQEPPIFAIRFDNSRGYCPVWGKDALDCMASEVPHTATDGYDELAGSDLKGTFYRYGINHETGKMEKI